MESKVPPGAVAEIVQTQLQLPGLLSAYSIQLTSTGDPVYVLLNAMYAECSACRSLAFVQDCAFQGAGNLTGNVVGMIRGWTALRRRQIGQHQGSGASPA